MSDGTTAKRLDDRDHRNQAQTAGYSCVRFDKMPIRRRFWRKSNTAYFEVSKTPQELTNFSAPIRAEKRTRDAHGSTEQDLTGAVCCWRPRFNRDSPIKLIAALSPAHGMSLHPHGHGRGHLHAHDIDAVRDGPRPTSDASYELMSHTFVTGNLLFPAAISQSEDSQVIVASPRMPTSIGHARRASGDPRHQLVERCKRSNGLVSQIDGTAAIHLDKKLFKIIHDRLA
jgi:hypothetical protein